MGKREQVDLLNLSSWCLMMVGWLFLAVPRGCLQFVIVVFPDHTHLLFFESRKELDQPGHTPISIDNVYILIKVLMYSTAFIQTILG